MNNFKKIENYFILYFQFLNYNTWSRRNSSATHGFQQTSAAIHGNQ